MKIDFTYLFAIIVLIHFSNAEVIEAQEAALGGFVWSDFDEIAQEDQVLAEIDAASNDETLELSSKLGKKQLQSLMQRGMFDAAVQLVALYRGRNIDLSSKVYQQAALIRKRLTGVTESLSMRSVPKIAPAFQWAQSPDTVFLNVKFAHKLDTPSTLGCNPEEPVYKDTKVLFSADCKEKKKRFVLELDLFEAVNATDSTWSVASVGRAMISIRKIKESNWPRLLRTKSKLPNMHVWWDMKAQHENVMREFDREQQRNTSQTNATTTNTTSQSTPTATPSPTPEPTGIELQKLNLQKQRKSEKDTLQQELKDAISKVNSDGRKRRQEVEDKAKQEKQTIDADIKSQIQELRSEHKEKIKAIDDKYQKEIDELHDVSTGNKVEL